MLPLLKAVPPSTSLETHLLSPSAACNLACQLCPCACSKTGRSPAQQALPCAALPGAQTSFCTISSRSVTMLRGRKPAAGAADWPAGHSRATCSNVMFQPHSRTKRNNLWQQPHLFECGQVLSSQELCWYIEFMKTLAAHHLRPGIAHASCHGGLPQE